MTTNGGPAITAAAVIAADPDRQPTGEHYIELAMTGATVAGVSPHGRRVVAAFLQALLNRAPMLEGPAYAAHREILGVFCLELESLAIAGALDEPPPPLTDLRDPGIAARERQLLAETRAWADGERSRRSEAARKRIDELVDVAADDHDRAFRRLEDATRRAEAFQAGSAAPEADDASAWLA